MNQVRHNPWYLFWNVMTCNIATIFILFQGFCGICYKVCDTPSSVLMPFQMSDLFVSQTDASCNTDWIQIPCATDQQSTSQLLSDGITSCVNKLCGSYFNAVTASTVNAPVYSIVLWFLNGFVVVGSLHLCYRLSKTVRSSCLHRHFRPYVAWRFGILPEIYAAALHD